MSADDIPDLIFSPKARRTGETGLLKAFSSNGWFAAVPSMEQLGSPTASSFPLGISQVLEPEKLAQEDEGVQADSNFEITDGRGSQGIRQSGVERSVSGEDVPESSIDIQSTELQGQITKLGKSSALASHLQTDKPQLEDLFMSVRNRLVSQAHQSPNRPSNHWTNYRMHHPDQQQDFSFESKGDEVDHPNINQIRAEISELSERIDLSQKKTYPSDPSISDLESSLFEAKRTISNLQDLVESEAKHTAGLESEIARLENHVRISVRESSNVESRTADISGLRYELGKAKDSIKDLERRLSDEKSSSARLSCYLKDVRGDTRDMRMSTFFRETEKPCRSAYCHCMQEQVDDWKRRLRQAQEQQWELLMKHKQGRTTN
jgi:chromosome segregation ATPase